jgi:hypothetical protein
MPTTLLGMKHAVTRFKSLEIALKELEPFIRDGAHLQTGNPFKRFGQLRSREILANWLLCVAINHAHPDRLTFCAANDPIAGDGVIVDTQTGETWPTEHTLVPTQRRGPNLDAEGLILKAINHKRKVGKGGEAYAPGKTLVVFLNAGAGAWFPNEVARRLPDPLLFDAVWVVGLHGPVTDRYVYGVTRLDLRSGNAPTWLVSITDDFKSWVVRPYQ